MKICQPDALRKKYGEVHPSHVDPAYRMGRCFRYLGGVPPFDGILIRKDLESTTPLLCLKPLKEGLMMILRTGFFRHHHTAVGYDEVSYYTIEEQENPFVNDVPYTGGMLLKRFLQDSTVSMTSMTDSLPLYHRKSIERGRIGFHYVLTLLLRTTKRQSVVFLSFNRAKLRNVEGGLMRILPSKYISPEEAYDLQVSAIRRSRSVFEAAFKSS